MREYGLDLRQVVRVDSPRRVWTLLRGLSANSATWSGEEQWTRTEELLALLLEKFGVQIQRPGQQTKPGGTVAATPEQILAYFRGM